MQVKTVDTAIVSSNSKPFCTQNSYPKVYGKFTLFIHWFTGKVHDYSKVKTMIPWTLMKNVVK